MVSDLPTLCSQQQDPEANALAGVPARDRQAFIEHFTTNVLGNVAVIKRTIVEHGAIAGHILCFERDGRREVGYWLGRAFRGRGIGSTAVSAFLPLVGLRPLYGVVSPANVASIRVLQKCGFVCHQRDDNTETWRLD